MTAAPASEPAGPAGQRRATLRLWLDGEPLAAFGDSVLSLEVDERADEASTLRMTLDLSPVATGAGEGDWDALEYGAFAEAHGLPAFRLLSRVTVQLGLADATGPGGSAGGSAEATATVFDGFVTAVEPVFGESRVPDSILVLMGIDASCLMHLETITRPWHGLADAQIAAELFGKYGFDASPDATIEDGRVSRIADRPGLVQRGTDAEFLRMLARRNGFEWYVEPAGGRVRPGSHPGTDVVGHFHSPRVDGPEQPVLSLFPREAPTLKAFRARYDSHQPARIRSWHVDEQSRLLQRVDVADTGLTRMGSHSRADVLTERLAAIQPLRRGAATTAGPGSLVGAGGAGGLTTLDIASGDVPHSAVELLALARAGLRTTDWFVSGRGTVQAERYGAILRPRRPVRISGAGHLLDGRWYVQGVRHRWGVDPEDPQQEQTVRRYEADVTVVRNALGGLP